MFWRRNEGMGQQQRVGGRESADGWWWWEFWREGGPPHRQDHMLSPACSCHANGSRNFNTFWQCVSWALPLIVCCMCVWRCDRVVCCVCMCVCVCMFVHYAIVFSHSSSLVIPSSYSHLVLLQPCAKFPGSQLTPCTCVHNCTHSHTHTPDANITQCFVMNYRIYTYVQCAKPN